MCSSTQLFFKPACWSLSEERINSFMRRWRYPGAAEALSFGPFGYFSTELTSRIVFARQGARTTVASTRNQPEAMASMYSTYHCG